MSLFWVTFGGSFGSPWVPLLDHLGWLFWVTLGWSGSVEGVPGVEKSGVHFPGSKTVPFPVSVIEMMTESWIRSNFQALEMVGVFSTSPSQLTYPCHLFAPTPCPLFAPTPCPPFQAFAVWRWSNYLHDQCAARGKRPLLINLDETSVPVVFAHVKGNFMVHNGRRAWRSRVFLRSRIAWQAAREAD
jgi:hypothetical protein